MLKNNIKKLRKQLGLNQTEFGKKIGKSLRAIQEWESGRREPSKLTVELISSVFGIDEGWTYGETALLPKENSSDIDPEREIDVAQKREVKEISSLLSDYGSPVLIRKIKTHLKQIKEIEDKLEL